MYFVFVQTEEYNCSDKRTTKNNDKRISKMTRFRVPVAPVGLLLLATVCLCSLAGLAQADDKKDKDKDIGTVIGIDLGTTYSW